MEVVYVTGDQKSDFKNLKQEKQNVMPLRSSIRKPELAMGGLYLPVPGLPASPSRQVGQWSSYTLTTMKVNTYFPLLQPVGRVSLKNSQI